MGPLLRRYRARVLGAAQPALARAGTINPYRHAAYELLGRLAWDLRPESWRSRRALAALRDRHAGRAVILCNGPSLLRSDLSLLGGVYCLGLNKINLLFDRSPFRPSCVVAVNPLVLEQNAAFFNATAIPLFLDAGALGLVRPRPGVVFLHSSDQRKFARDVSVSVHQGSTVTFVAMQLAFHLGFRELALIGCDHSFGARGPAHKIVEGGAEDRDHFDPRYFAGQRWELPNLADSEAGYAMADEVFRAAGGAIVNCTEGGALELLSRMPLADFVRGAPLPGVPPR